jgi:hypothetical protein
MLQEEEEGRIILLEGAKGIDEVDKIKCVIRVGVTWIALSFDVLREVCEKRGRREGVR